MRLKGDKEGERGERLEEASKQQHHLVLFFYNFVPDCTHPAHTMHTQPRYKCTATSRKRCTTITCTINIISFFNNHSAGCTGQGLSSRNILNVVVLVRLLLCVYIYIFNVTTTTGELFYLRKNLGDEFRFLN